MLKQDLNSIILSKDMAKFGDAYINFLYSAALTAIRGIPSGVKVSDKILVEAAKISGMREILPKRTSKGRVADAVEALLIYSIIKGFLGFKEMIDCLILEKDNPSEGFAEIISTALRRLISNERSSESIRN